MRNQEGKIEVVKKVHLRICLRDITFLAARPSSGFFAYYLPPCLSSTQILLRKKYFLLQKMVLVVVGGVGVGGFGWRPPMTLQSPRPCENFTTNVPVRIFQNV